MDPLTILASVKAGIAAGQEIASLAKGIGELFDSIDDARNAHEKKKSSPFAPDDENAMDSYIKLCQARDAEESLRAIVISARGYSGWQELLKLRGEIRTRRKEAEAARKRRNQERFEATVIWGGIGTILTITVGFVVVAILANQGKL